MVNRIFLLSGIVAILSVLSCSKMEIKENDAPVNPVREGRRTIEATMEEAFDEETKMTLGDLDGEKRTLSWSAGDKIAVIGSDKKTYLFTADSEGTKVRFTEADPDENDELNNNPMPDEVNIVYAFYPYDKIKSFTNLDPEGSVDEGKDWVRIIAELPSVQSGNLLDNLLIAASREKNVLSFHFEMFFWKFTVPQEWGITKLTMRSVDPKSVLTGDVNFSFKKGTNSIGNSGCTSDFVTYLPKAGEDFVSGEIVLATRHRLPNLTDFSKILEFENGEGQFAFMKMNAVAGARIFNFGDLQKKGSLKWYDKQTINVKFTKAGWSFSPARDYSLFDDNKTINHYLSDRPYEFTTTGGDYLFKVFAPDNIYPADTGLRLGANESAKAYIEFPSLQRMALANVKATFTQTGGKPNNGESNIVDNSGVPLLAPCGEGDVTRIWNFVGLANTTKVGTAYRMLGGVSGGNKMTTAELELTYLGSDVTRPDAVSTGNADVYATLSESHPDEGNNKPAYIRPFSDANVTLHGSFKMHTGRHASSPATIDDFKCGFEYKAADDAEWTSVACPEAAETFSVNVALNEDTDYLYRSYANVSGEDRCYGMERRLKFIAFDFRNGTNAQSMSAKSGLYSGNATHSFSKNENREFHYPDATAKSHTFSCGYCNGGSGANYSMTFNPYYIIFNKPTDSGGQKNYLGFPAVQNYKLTAYTIYMQGVQTGTRTLAVSSKSTGSSTSDDPTIELFASRQGIATRQEVVVPTNGKTRQNTGYYLIQNGNNWPITTIALKYE